MAATQNRMYINTCVSLALIFAASQAEAERPNIGLLLPEDTAIVVHVSDIQEAARRLSKTTYGDIIRDDSLQPLVDQLTTALAQPLEQLASRLGTDLATLIKLPQGELSVAMFSLGEQFPAFVALVDVGDDTKMVQGLLERLELELLGTGADFESRTVGQQPVSIFKTAGESPTEIAITLRDQTIILANSGNAVEEILKRWSGDRADGCLEHFENYNETLRYARVERRAKSSIYAYIQPLDIYRSFTAGNFAAQAGLAFVPLLGLDGVRGIGVNLVLQQRPFDSVLHAHLLLDKKRKGVVDVIALETTDTAPQPWVPDDVVSFQSFHWDVKKSFQAVRRVMEDMQGEGAFEEMITDRISEQLGIDFERDLIDALTGDFVRLTWYEPLAEPTGDTTQDALAPFQRQSSVIGIRLAGRDRFEEIFRSVVNGWGERLQEEKSGETIIYSTRNRTAEQAPDSQREETQRQRRRRRRRGPQVTFALFREYLLIADRIEPIEHILKCDEIGPTLSDSAPFQLAIDAARDNFGGGPPMVLSFTQADRVQEYRWSLLQSKAILEGLRDRFAENATLLEVLQAFDDHALPSWEQLAKYVAPVVSVVADGENGLHYTQYRLRPVDKSDNSRAGRSKTSSANSQQ